MQLGNARILLTGAAGGLGRELAMQLSEAGAYLLLDGRDVARLEALKGELGHKSSIVCADLTTSEGVQATAQAAQIAGINVVINNAGASAFGLVERQAWQSIEQVLETSLAAPLRLTHTLLPWLRAQPQAAIVNVGSAFGSLPFPGFAAYSAAKAGLRGFSQALRRELADTQVSVIHISPRAIRTPMNSDAVNALNRALNTPSDEAHDVARQIVRALKCNATELQIGFPERIFTWLNGFAPSLIDRALVGKLSTVKEHAQPRVSK